MERARHLLSELWIFRKTLIVFLAPVILLPIPLCYTSEAGRCAYGILIMGLYWVSEAIPIAVTALLPIVLFPWLGVLGSKDICKNYLKDGNMLFVGGLIVAVAVERWNLHKRIALRVLLIVGSRPKWLMFGFMITTAFLSMWISNTATTAMMVPIAQAVLLSLEGKEGIMQKKKSLHRSLSVHRKSSAKDTDGKLELEEIARLYDQGSNPDTHDDGSPDNIVSMPEDTEDSAIEGDTGRKVKKKKQSSHEREVENLGKGLCLCVAYAANIGGTATLTGTPTNIVLKGQVSTLYGGESGVNYTSWFIISFPNMLISLFLAWIWLQLLYLGPRELLSFLPQKRTKEEGEVAAHASQAAAVVIRREYHKLGAITFAEAAVLVHFIVLALLWVTREPEFVSGYSDLLRPGYVTDACVAITVSISLFICPSRRPSFLCCKRKGETAESVPALLDWKTVHHNMAWNVVILLGGGFALAEACKESKLSAAIGSAFEGFGDFPVWVLVLVLCAVTAGFTEFTSNVATCTIFIPILAELAKSLQVNPLYLIIPVTISTSFAFMLPVATPPNAIVFAYGRLRIIDMVKAGIVMNTLCLLVLQMSVNTWMYAYFDLGEYPDWADKADVTTSTPMNITVPYDVIT